MSVQKDKWVTPIYQGLLAQCLGGVLTTFAVGSPSQCLDSLKTLYDIMDSDIKAELKGMIDDINMNVAKMMSKRGYATADIVNKERLLKTYVGEKKHELFEKTIQLLFAHGYLKKEGLPTRVRDLKSIGEALE